MSQKQVREWWNRNPMSYDVGAPIPHPQGTREYFREIDRRLELARETLRRDTEATCAKWNCDYLHKRDDDFIAERRAGAWPAHWFRDRLL